MTGVEGYVESAASGLVAGINLANELCGLPPFIMPDITALGGLASYISGASVGKFVPMNITFGIMTPLGQKIKGKGAKAEKNRLISMRSLEYIDSVKDKTEDKNNGN